MNVRSKAKERSNLSSVLILLWALWNIFAALGFIGFALRIIAPDQPGHPSLLDLLMWLACALTVTSNIIAGIIYNRGAYGGENLSSIIARQDY